MGDLKFTIPLADHLRERGHDVEDWYDRSYGDPFTYFPSVTRRPRNLVANIPTKSLSAAIQQVQLYAQMWRPGRRVVWNQIYPFRLDAYARNAPYPTFWYRRFPEIDFRRARTTLEIGNDGTILYFATSGSLNIGPASAHAAWLEANLERLREHTGYRVVYVPPPGAADHARYETWRGTLDAYQRLIARCAIVFGIITSAHVLAQLIGKPIVACYARRDRMIDTIGAETVRLFPHDELDATALARIDRLT